MLEWTVGDVRITSVAEMDDGVLPAQIFLPDAAPAALGEIEWLRPRFVDDDGNIRLRIQALVVESQGRQIVVDTCIGADKERTIDMLNGFRSTLPADLAAAGFPRESIDTVICTHLHVDHVGWNTMLVDGEWVPTFDNARYLLSRVDVEHWTTADSGIGDVFGDSVRPVIEAGLADLVDPPLAVTDEVSLFPSVGHSPGHMSVRIRSGGAEAVITGDVMHHPCQVARPAWGSSFDVDGAQAEKTRREFLEEFADRDVLVIGTHFATPTAGKIVRAGDAYAFVT
jgi:glyoxylase-like metal-dependent hydrolase (beta-lactamase superfamily II)